VREAFSFSQPVPRAPKERTGARSNPARPAATSCLPGQFVGVITISTLRFSARPAMVELVAIGSPKPRPETDPR